MKTVTCHLCKSDLILDAKTLDDQAEQFMASGWSEAYDNSGALIITCPACLEQVKTGKRPKSPSPQTK